MPDQIPGNVSGERSRRLHELGQRLTSGFHRRFVGRRLPVLWEDCESLGTARRWSGLTPNYIRVLTESDDSIDLANRVAEIDIEHVVPGAVAGSIPGTSWSGIEAESRRETGALPVVGEI